MESDEAEKVLPRDRMNELSAAAVRNFLLVRTVGGETKGYIWVSLNDRGGVKEIGYGQTKEDAMAGAKPVLPGEFVGGRLAQAFQYGGTPFYNEVAQRFQELADLWAQTANQK
jgi:hypothetical protein